MTPDWRDPECNAPPRSCPTYRPTTSSAAGTRASWQTRRGPDIVLIKTLLHTGGRVAELVALRLGDVDLDNCRIRIQNGKGGKDRRRAVPAVVRRSLEIYSRSAASSSELPAGCFAPRATFGSTGPPSASFLPGVTKRTFTRPAAGDAHGDDDSGGAQPATVVRVRPVRLHRGRAARIQLDVQPSEWAPVRLLSASVLLSGGETGSEVGQGASSMVVAALRYRESSSHIRPMTSWRACAAPAVPTPETSNAARRPIGFAPLPMWAAAASSRPIAAPSASRPAVRGQPSHDATP